MRRVVRWRNALIATATAVVVGGASMLAYVGSGFNQPTNSVAPEITGLTQVGRSLDCSAGTWGPSGDPPTSYAISWENSPDGSAWAEVGTGSPYAVAATDENDLLRCRVAAANPNGTVSAVSASTNAISPNDPTIITSDTFAAADSTDLGVHVGEQGADWTKHPSFSQDSFITGNRLRGDGNTNRADYYASGVPTDADYDVVADMRWVSMVTSDQVGIWGRHSTTTHTGYRVVWFQGVGPHGWELSKWESGVKTSLGSYSEDPVVGATRTVKLEMRGTAIKVYIDGTERISVTDGSITAAGRVGTQTRFATATTGVHIDSVYANHPVVAPPAVACANGLDDDSDTFTDFPNDAGCANALDDDETNTAACANSADDDGDTLIDYPEDPGCSSAADNDEYNAPPPPPPTEAVANVWGHHLSTGTCARFVAPAEYDAATACPDTANAGAVGRSYAIASSNDVAKIRGGTYTQLQRVVGRAGITGVVMAPSGGNAIFTRNVCLGDKTSTCGTGTDVAPDNFTIDADAGDGDFILQNVDFYIDDPSNDRAENITIRGGYFTRMYLRSTSDSLIENVDVGNFCCTDDTLVFGFSGTAPAEDLTIRGAYIHDHQNECRYNVVDATTGRGRNPCPLTTLASDVSAGATSIPLTDSMGWVVGQTFEVIYFDVTRETKTVTAVNGNTLTVSPAITNAYSAGTIIWAGSTGGDAHVDCIAAAGMLGTLTIENTRIYNCGSQGIFLGDAPSGTYNTPCTIQTVACYEDVVIRNVMVDTCAACGASPNNAFNTKVSTSDPSWAPGSSILLEHVSTTMGLNSFHGGSDGGATRAVDTITIRNSLAKWAGSCTFAVMSYGVDSVTFDNNAFDHTDAGAACSADEDDIGALSDEFVSSDDAETFSFDLRLVGGADAIDCGDAVTFLPTDLFGATRPLGAAPDCGAHEKS